MVTLLQARSIRGVCVQCAKHSTWFAQLSLFSSVRTRRFGDVEVTFAGSLPQGGKASWEGMPLLLTFPSRMLACVEMQDKEVLSQDAARSRISWRVE